MSIKKHIPRNLRKRYKIDQVIKMNPHKKYVRFYLDKSNYYTYCAIVVNGVTLSRFSSRKDHVNCETPLMKIASAKMMGERVAKFVLDSTLNGTFVYDLNGMKNHGRIKVVIDSIRAVEKPIIKNTQKNDE